MKKFLSVALLIISSAHVQAQVSHGGEPLNWTNPEIEVYYERLPELDIAAIEAEDAINDQYKEFGYRFGIERSTDFSTRNSGSWTTENGNHVWRFGVYAPNAKGVSFLFSEYDIPKSAKLFIYDKEKTHFIGAFNYKNTQATGMLATSLVYGDHIIVEVTMPESESIEKVNLTIGQIVHAYRGINSKFEELKHGRGPFGNSGPCNINPVHCGPAWYRVIPGLHLDVDDAL